MVSKTGVSEDPKAFGRRPWEHRGGIFLNEGCRGVGGRARAGRVRSSDSYLGVRGDGEACRAAAAGCSTLSSGDTPGRHVLEMLSAEVLFRDLVFSSAKWN